MRAWVCETPTGVAALRWTDLPTPEPGPGEVRIAVKAASLNFPDALIIENKYQVKPPLPFVPGSEFSGVVEAVGAGVETARGGDEVIVVGDTGGFATHAIARAAHLTPKPAGFSFEEAAAFALTYGTSHHALLDRGRLRAGETVLVLGAAGGVGTAAIQIATAAGARVIAAVSSDEKAAFCLSLGADAAICYSRENLRDRIKSLTEGRGVDIVYDPVGGDLSEPAFRSLAWRGRFLVVGFAQGTIPSLPLNLALLKGADLVGIYWGDFVRREPGRSRDAVATLSRWYAEGTIKPVLDQVLPMERLPEAYARMAARQVLGKLILVNS